MQVCGRRPGAAAVADRTDDLAWGDPAAGPSPRRLEHGQMAMSWVGISRAFAPEAMGVRTDDPFARASTGYALRLMGRAARWYVAVGFATAAFLAAGAVGGWVANYPGYEDAAARALGGDWWRLWSLPPVEVVLIGALAGGLALVISRLPADRRGGPSMFAFSALAVLLVAVGSPIAGLAQGGMFAAHMSQHVLVGAVAPLLVVLALPRAIPSPARAPASVLRLALHPVVAFGLWTASTLVWLVPAVHHQVMISQAAWVVQQVSFFLFGLALWAPVTERFVAAPKWFGTGAKCAYMLGVWSVGLTLANMYWFAGSAFYEAHSAGAQVWGLSPMQDQANAATVMMATHCFIAFGAIAILFFRQSREDSLAQRLIEAGADPEQVRWEVRYGDPTALADRSGVAIHHRPGLD